MSEQELPNLRGVEDLLIADVASHVADETFFLVAPIDDTNCCVSDSQSHWIVEALAKQTRHWRWCVGRLSDA